MKSLNLVLLIVTLVTFVALVLVCAMCMQGKAKQGDENPVLQRFASRLLGNTSGDDLKTVTPSDERYLTLVRGFNSRWVGNASEVIICSTVKDITSAVKRAIQTHKRVTVGSGYHCYEDFTVATSGILIDLSTMMKLYKQKDGLIVVEPGVNNWTAQQKMFKEWNVSLPGGSCYSVCAGGHICGGGYGLLSRMHGLTVDWLYGVEVVTVDKNYKVKVVQVFEDSKKQVDRDLWWAHTGGGGGNFGIITKYFFKEAPVPPQIVFLAVITIDWKDDNGDVMSFADFSNLLTRYGLFWKNDQVNKKYFSMFSLFKLKHISNSNFAIVLQATSKSDVMDFINFVFPHTGPTGSTETCTTSDTLTTNAIQFHNNIASTITIHELPWLYTTMNLNGSGDSQRFKNKSANMRDVFPDHQIQTLYNWMTGVNMPTFNNSQALVQIDSYGGVVNDKKSTDRAVPFRDSIMKLQYQVYWVCKENDEENLSWIRGLYNDMYGENGPYPDAVMQGAYVNYPDVDLHNWQYLYYGDNYHRLQSIKKAWDPNNFFNHKQSIELP
jgi:hypothetical protein